MMKRFQLFSFDVVESAAFKLERSTGDESPQWLESFQSFFEEVPLIFAAEIAKSFFDEEGDIPCVPVWKAIGDELVFIAQPESVHDLDLLTLAFVESVARVNDRLNRKWGLRIHGVCWSFQEGGKNQMIRFRELEDHEKHVLDFIGPDVDLGFRLTTHAKPGCVLTSQEHAALLSEQFSVQQVGEKVLKGISKTPYPLLQINCCSDFLIV